MNVDQRVLALLEAAIRPSEADVLRARAVILKRLEAGVLASREELVRLVYRGGDVEVEPARDAYVDVALVQRDPEATLDRETVPLKQQRLRTATYEALAQLCAEGVLLTADPDHSKVQVAVGSFTGGSGWTGGEWVGTDRPMVADGFKLSGRWANSPAVTEISTVLDANGLQAILHERGMRCWLEAVAAFSRGLYLASAGMVGAASEAAWYALGDAVQDEPRLAKPLGDDNTVQVMQLVAEHLRQAPRSKTTANELQAHAVYLRDLRNYGLHPRPDEDAPRRGRLYRGRLLGPAHAVPQILGQTARDSSWRRDSARPLVSQAVESPARNIEHKKTQPEVRAAGMGLPILAGRPPRVLFEPHRCAP